MRFRNILFISILFVFGGGLKAAAGEGINPITDNWPQWRGPLANGVSMQAKPPIKWGPSENIQWKIAIPGHGSSSPIVWGDRVFVLSAEKIAEENAEPKKEEAASAEQQPELAGNEQRGRRRGGPGRGGSGRGAPPTERFAFLVHCLNRATGEVIWKQTATEAIPKEGHHGNNGYASPSPVTDGQRLVASFGSQGIFCYDLDGKKLWERNLGQMVIRNSFGEGSSPAMHDGLVFIQWDHEGGSKFFALDALTGEIRWSVDREEGTDWATPYVIEHGGVAQVITNATNKVRSYEAKTGKLLWSCGGQTANVIPSPVVADGVAYCMSGFRGSAIRAIGLDAQGDLADGDPAIRWKFSGSTPYVPSPMLYDKLLYFLGGNKGILSVIDAPSGKLVLEPKRLEGIGEVYASPVGAAGRAYIVGREGATVVLEHGAEAKVLAVNDLEEPIDASPALAGNQIFLRGAQHLYCIAEKSPSASAAQGE